MFAGVTMTTHIYTSIWATLFHVAKTEGIRKGALQRAQHELDQGTNRSRGQLYDLRVRTETSEKMAILPGSRDREQGHVICSSAKNFDGLSMAPTEGCEERKALSQEGSFFADVTVGYLAFAMNRHTNATLFFAGIIIPIRFHCGLSRGLLRKRNFSSQFGFIEEGNFRYFLYKIVFSEWFRNCSAFGILTAISIDVYLLSERKSLSGSRHFNGFVRTRLHAGKQT